MLSLFDTGIRAGVVVSGSPLSDLKLGVLPYYTLGGYNVDPITFTSGSSFGSASGSGPRLSHGVGGGLEGQRVPC